jgi:hypothetical protein
MEVHHHSHTGAGQHQRKKWAHYFWEFLMLFLAVFCGFLAEYQLEHYIEKQRAKDYAFSLHSDIKTDTGIYTRTTRALNTCIKKIDSLILILGSHDNIKKNTSTIYRLSLYAFIFPTNMPNEATLQQLLNSGSLRYFKNHLLIDSIKQFNTEIHLFNNFAGNAMDFNLEFRKMQARLVELNPIIEFLGSSTILEDVEAQIESIADFTDAMLISYESALIKEYANWCALKKFYMLNTIAKYNNLKKMADSIVTMLDEAYHLN